MGIERDYSVLQRQDPYKVDIVKLNTNSIGLTSRTPLAVHGDGMNVMVSQTSGEPGTTIDWHTHQSIHNQIVIPLQGTHKWYYKDNNGEVQTFIAEPGEWVYLPGSFENKFEVIGDEPVEHIAIQPNMYHNRLETFLGRGHPEATETSEDHNYSWQDLPIGLWYDSRLDKIVRKDENALIE